MGDIEANTILRIQEDATGGIDWTPVTDWNATKYINTLWIEAPNGFGAFPGEAISVSTGMSGFTYGLLYGSADRSYFFIVPAILGFYGGAGNNDWTCYLWCAEPGTYTRPPVGSNTPKDITTPYAGWSYITYNGNALTYTVDYLDAAPSVTVTDMLGLTPSQSIQESGLFSSNPPVPLPGISAGLYFLEENDVLTPLDNSGVISDLETRMATLEAWQQGVEAAAAAANGTSA